eukprot:jgi/Mesen1/7221/ME000372S06464
MAKRKQKVNAKLKAKIKAKVTDTRTTKRKAAALADSENSAKRPKEAVSSDEAPVILFAHGAGVGSSSDWMVRWKGMLKEATQALDVITFDYPYLKAGKKAGPPKAENLVEFHAQQLLRAQDSYPGHPLILCGKSMGSRVGCMVAADESCGAAAVVCIGYPLKVGRCPSSLSLLLLLLLPFRCWWRAGPWLALFAELGGAGDGPLLELKLPVLFVQGSKDKMCPLPELEELRKRMTVRSDVFAIEGGDHSLKVRAKLQDESDKNAAAAVAAFVASVLKDAKTERKEVEEEAQPELEVKPP